MTSAIEIPAAATIACGETSVRRLSRPKLARQLPVLAERVGQPREAGDRGRRRGEQHERTGEADVDDAARRRPARGRDRWSASTIPASGALSHSSPSAVWPFSTGKAERPTTATAPSARRRARSPRRGSAAASAPARGSPRRGWRRSRGPCRRASPAAARRRGRPTSATLPAVPCVSTSGEKSSARPRITSSSCVARSSPATTMPAGGSGSGATSRTAAIASDHATATIDVPGDSRSTSTPRAVPR